MILLLCTLLYTSQFYSFHCLNFTLSGGVEHTDPGTNSHNHSSNDSVMKLDSDRTSGKPYHMIVTIFTI